MKKLTTKEINLIAKNKKIRVGIAKKSFYIFFLIYFRKYITYELAFFQKEMIDLASERNDRFSRR